MKDEIRWCNGCCLVVWDKDKYRKINERVHKMCVKKTTANHSIEHMI